MDKDNSGDNELSPEVQAQASAVMIIADNGVQRATEQLFYGLNSIAPTPMPEVMMKIAIGHAVSGWLQGVEESLDLVREAARYVLDNTENGDN